MLQENCSLKFQKIFLSVHTNISLCHTRLSLSDKTARITSSSSSSEHLFYFNTKYFGLKMWNSTYGFPFNLSQALEKKTPNHGK